MKKAIALYLACVGLLGAQSVGFLTGEHWLSWSTKEKLVYVIAVADVKAAVQGSRLNGLVPPDPQGKLVESYTPASPSVKFETLVEAIDRLYSEPANRGISVLRIMEVVAAKFNGATDACVSETLVFDRLQVANYRNFEREPLDSPVFEGLKRQATRMKTACGV
jgi:hypothetical protein